MKAFTFGTVAIGIVLGVVDARFIEVDSLLWCEFIQSLEKGLSFGFIAFLVGVGLFFRVNPMCLSARPIVSSLIGVSHS